MDKPFKEKSIGSHNYRAYALPMDAWARLSEYLGEFLGQPVAELVKGFRAIDVRELILGNPAALAGLFATFTSKLTAQRLQALQGHMAPCLQVMDDRGEYSPLSAAVQNEWWACNRGELAPVVWLFLQAQYEDFFRGFAALMPTPEPSGSDPQKSTNDPRE